MNLKELSKLDLKNIDISKAFAYLGVHTDALIRMSLVIGTVLGGFHVVNDYLEQTKIFSLRIAQMEEKLLQVMTYEKSVSSLKSFWEKAPKPINEDALVNYMTELAAKNHLDVLSFSPGQISSDKFYTINKVKFKLKARDYKDFLLFVHGIENSGYALRVESISCSLEQMAAQQAGSTVINIQMEIASIRLNEQKNIQI